MAKYYDGMATEEEEAELLRMFNEEETPECLKDEKDFFINLHNCQNATHDVPEGFEDRLGALIDRCEKDERTTKRNLSKRMSRLRVISGIAASLLLLAGMGVYLNGNGGMDEKAEMDEATYAKAQYAIMKFSSTLNKGLEQMDKAEEKTAIIGNVLDKYYGTDKNIKE